MKPSLCVTPDRRYGQYLKKYEDDTSHRQNILQLLRLLRLLRIFELLKFQGAEKAFGRLRNVAHKNWEDLSAALGIMFISLVFIASLMYLVEGQHDRGYGDNFDSIPKCMYWGVITVR